ncbi:putative zinc-type alcohol dehydrogenase-like protein [Aspergillus ellipticus CBS 707.79]|uniref:Putative zinc-type alcohol dehydrogenase-like protein n=1 Tax=Aspergillus ellipticus CBS 707.79 TaxID=1448320 RepID=A0A319DY01_9EURO|nr:putative zinc-type alcohol dehydrogenase-like protein [Aspergillus ellipticus CBS 707.79]
MPTQTVFRFPHRATFTDLISHTEPISPVSKHELLIRIRAVSLNSRDLQVATKKYPFPVTNGLIPCSDGAGDIVEVGDAVLGFRKGDRVVISFDLANLAYIDGVLAQYVVRPAASVVRVPPTARQSYCELAALVCTGVTAWNGLFGNCTGGVALTALVIGKAAGATTIITSSSDEKLESVKAKFQPDYCINYKKTPDWAAEALKIVGEKGVDHIIEIGGVRTIEQSVKAIAYGGVISVIGYLTGFDPSKMPNVPLLALGKSCVVRGVLIGPKCMLDDLYTFADRAGLRLPAEKGFGFTREDIVAAYEELDSGRGIGKICIRLD